MNKEHSTFANNVLVTMSDDVSIPAILVIHLYNKKYDYEFSMRYDYKAAEYRFQHVISFRHIQRGQ